MEYLPAGDLSKYIDPSLPEEQGRQIVYQLLEGLSFMHEAGFAHRDLKPAVSISSAVRDSAHSMH